MEAESVSYGKLKLPNPNPPVFLFFINYSIWLCKQKNCSRDDHLFANASGSGAAPLSRGWRREQKNPQILILLQKKIQKENPNPGRAGIVNRFAPLSAVGADPGRIRGQTGSDEHRANGIFLVLLKKISRSATMPPVRNFCFSEDALHFFYFFDFSEKL